MSIARFMAMICVLALAACTSDDDASEPIPERDEQAPVETTAPAETTTTTTEPEDDGSPEEAVERWVTAQDGVYLGTCDDDLEIGAGLCSVPEGERTDDRAAFGLGEPRSGIFIWLLVERQDGEWTVTDEYIPEDSYDLSDAPEWVE